MLKQKLMLFVGIPLLFILLVYGADTETLNYSTIPKWIYVSAALLPLVFVAQPKRSFFRGPLLLWWLFVLLFIVQSFNAYNQWEALTHSVPLILAPLVGLVIDSKNDEPSSSYLRLARILALVLLPILLYASFELVSLLASHKYDHHSTYGFRYAFGHRNQFGQFIALSLPLFLWGIWKEKGWMRLGFAFVALLSVGIVFLLWNRTSILIVFGAYPLIVAGWLVFRKWITSRRMRITLGSVVLVLVGLLFVPSIRKKTPVVGPLLETGFGSGNERVRLWSNSLDLWKEKPVLGHGSGDWKIEILRTDLIHTQAEYGKVFYQRAHNDFLQTLVELGVVGLLIFVAFLIWAIRGLARSDIDSILKILLIMGVVSFLITANFSFPMERIELLTLLFLYLMPGFTIASEKQEKSLWKALPVAFACGILLVFSLSWMLEEKQFFAYKKTGNLALLKTLNKDFYSIDPMSTPTYWEQANVRFGYKDFSGAGGDYKKSLRYNPYNIHAINNLGTCLYLEGDVGEAESLYRRALKLNPRFSDALINLAALRFNEGDVDDALANILEVPLENEPAQYKSILVPIAKAKCEWLMELHDDPPFDAFLMKVKDDGMFLYKISVDARNSWRSYEDELRFYMASQNE